VVPTSRFLGPGRFGAVLVATGLIALALASFDHRRSLNALRASYGPQPHSVAATIGILMAGLGVFALVAMSFGL
jgi:putative membrane protein